MPLAPLHTGYMLTCGSNKDSITDECLLGKMTLILKLRRQGVHQGLPAVKCQSKEDVPVTMNFPMGLSPSVGVLPGSTNSC